MLWHKSPADYIVNIVNISIVPLKFGVDIQTQTKVRVWKPKNPIWPPGGHFESDLAENQ